MSGELNRINPTVVEGAEDIFGADDRLIAAGSKRPGFWSSRVSGNRTKLTPTQLAKFQRQNKFKKSVKPMAARAESFEGQGCGCGGGNCQCAENIEARTYRKTPTSKGKTAGKARRMRQIKQGYNDEMDESMGKGKSTKASRKDRRDESKGMEKSMGNRAYSRVKTMDAETLVADENMVDLGSVDAFYGGGRKVEVSGDGITPTANPSVDEAFNVGNDVGINNTDQELMNVNPSVDANYGAENKDIVGTVQSITNKAGFRVNGWLASAVVVGIAGMAGYKYAKR